jgi:hypothetical protein
VKTYNKFSKLLNQSITETSHFLCIESKNQVLRPQKFESLKEIGTLDYKGCKYAKKKRKEKEGNSKLLFSESPEGNR